MEKTAPSLDRSALRAGQNGTVYNFFINFRIGQWGKMGHLWVIRKLDFKGLFHKMHKYFSNMHKALFLESSGKVTVSTYLTVELF